MTRLTDIPPHFVAWPASGAAGVWHEGELVGELRAPWFFDAELHQGDALCLDALVRGNPYPRGATVLTRDMQFSPPPGSVDAAGRVALGELLHLLRQDSEIESLQATVAPDGELALFVVVDLEGPRTVRYQPAQLRVRLAPPAP